MKISSSFISLCLISCATQKKDEPPTEEKNLLPKTQVIGNVASISPHSGFLLIQKYGLGRLPTDGLYQTLGVNGRAASIRPSGERVRDFFAADILNGEVQSGDAVIFRPNPKTPTVTTPSKTPNLTSKKDRLKTLNNLLKHHQ